MDKMMTLKKKSRIVVLVDMIFAPRNSIVFVVYIQINFVGIERVYRTEFLGVIIDSKLSGKIILIILVTNCQSVLVSYVKTGQINQTISDKFMLFLCLPIHDIL